VAVLLLLMQNSNALQSAAINPNVIESTRARITVQLKKLPPRRKRLQRLMKSPYPSRMCSSPRRRRILTSSLRMQSTKESRKPPRKNLLLKKRRQLKKKPLLRMHQPKKRRKVTESALVKPDVAREEKEVTAKKEEEAVVEEEVREAAEKSAVEEAEVASTGMALMPKASPSSRLVVKSPTVEEEEAEVGEVAEEVPKVVTDQIDLVVIEEAEERDLQEEVIKVLTSQLLRPLLPQKQPPLPPSELPWSSQRRYEH